MQHPRDTGQKIPRENKFLLVFASLLLVVGGVQAVALSIAHVRAVPQLAAAVEATSEDCAAAKQLAIKGIFSGSQSGTGVSFADKCIAAVPDASMINPGEINSQLNPKNYKCVGKRVRVSIDARGKITEKWSAIGALPQGKCSTIHCNLKGECSFAAETTGRQPENKSDILRKSYPNYGERDTIPTGEKHLALARDRDFDSKVVVPPSWPRNYPDDTVFDESGTPSNPPDQNPDVANPVLSPDLMQSMKRGFPDPEAFPSGVPEHYTPPQNISYSSEAESSRLGPSSNEPVNRNVSDPPASVGGQENTFAEPAAEQKTSLPKTCRFRLLNWCLW
ncbi:MAG: hypothetical protein HYS26_02770 [Candidatus Kaiserbacteria bacterium]|nr:MAG: hypothetical protein HYS26_02770 [Candidatus Kaiserbacteria bacterium]